MAASTAAADILRLDDVGHNFGGLVVLRSVSFAVPERAVVGLIGPNGSGKTTLFNAISGFLLPRKGTVSYLGAPLGATPVAERSRRGMLRTFQTPRVFEHMTVLENVMAGAWRSARTGLLRDLVGTPRARTELAGIARRGEEILERFELAGLAGTLASRLTAGQRRTLEIARAAAAGPRLVMLDEPSSGLNPGEIENLRRWIVRFRDDGTAVLLVSHDMDLMTAAHRVHVLYFGEIIASGTMADIRNDARVREVYLGV